VSKYIRIYEALCPDDPIAKDDPRRQSIMREMYGVCRAKTLAEAVSFVQWWNAWPNPQHLTAKEFAKEARKLCAKMK
jgi:hypothetical protein